jgi:DNA-3-methyladenine glycosylase II
MLTITSLPNPDQVAALRLELAERDPALAVAHAAAPVFPWRSKPGGFAGLVRMILEQQVSVASATAVWLRMEAGLGRIGPEEVLAASPEVLRGFGLSGQKARYVRALAEAGIDFDALRGLDDAAATARLTAVTGIGRWTAEAYLMICEGRTDFFPAGDVALQEALRAAEGWTERPKEKALYQRAESWRPHRGVAAHLLWAYYAHLKPAG